MEVVPQPQAHSGLGQDGGMLSRGALTAVTTHGLVRILNKFIGDIIIINPSNIPVIQHQGLC